MKKAMMIVAMVGVIAMAGVANAGVYLVDFTFGSPVATANDFTVGGVAGLVGTETTDSLAVTGAAGTLTTGGGIEVTFQNGHFANYRPDWSALVEPKNLLSDFAYGYGGGGGPAPMDVSIGNIDLDPSSNYTLYLWGHNFNVVLPGGYASTFTPVDGDVTFVSTTPTLAYLAVDFTTNASWDDVNHTIDFIWGSGPDDWNQFTGFAVVGGAEPIPEPAGLSLIGLALLAVRRRRS